MAVTYSQNGVIVKQDATWLANNNKFYARYGSSADDRGCLTNSFNIADANLIEENIVYKLDKWTKSESNWSLGGGQWYSGATSKFIGIAVYIWADKIEFDTKDGTVEYVNGISYDFSKMVRNHIIYDKNSGVATCKIYYDDILVCTYTKSISDLYFFNDVGYSLMGNRIGVIANSGYIDLNKSYIRIDGKLVWGVDNLKKDEAVIGGKAYRTVQMPDGKIWLAENLDFKFCNIGGSGTPTTANAWYYNNDETTYGWNGYKCGLLYNWYAAKILNDHRSELCPGWHVPTKDEYDALATACGGFSTAGTKLKALDGSAGTGFPSGWDGTDDYGFSLLPAGGYTGSFLDIGAYGILWSITDNSTIAHGINCGVSSNVSNFNDPKDMAYSIRLVRDAT